MMSIDNMNGMGAPEEPEGPPPEGYDERIEGPKRTLWFAILGFVKSERAKDLDGPAILEKIESGEGEAEISDARDALKAVLGDSEETNLVISNLVKGAFIMGLAQRSLKNFFEERRERIPTRDEVLGVIMRHAPNAEIVKDDSDEEGLLILEMKALGDKPGKFIEFDYRRKKNKKSRSGETLLSIHMTFYEDEVPYTGEEILLQQSASGGWEEIERAP